MRLYEFAPSMAITENSKEPSDVSDDELWDVATAYFGKYGIPKYSAASTFNLMSRKMFVDMAWYMVAPGKYTREEAEEKVKKFAAQWRVSTFSGVYPMNYKKDDPNAVYFLYGIMGSHRMFSPEPDDDMPKANF